MRNIHRHRHLAFNTYLMQPIQIIITRSPTPTRASLPTLPTPTIPPLPQPARHTATSTSLNNSRRSKSMTLPHESKRLEPCLLTWRMFAKHNLRARRSVQQNVQPAVAADHRACDAEVRQADPVARQRVDAAAGQRRRAHGVDEWVEDHER